MKRRNFACLFVLVPIILGTWLFLRCLSDVQHSVVKAEEYTPKYYQLDSAKIALGKRLFFDERLSGSNTISCATCHDPFKAFTDNKQFSIGEKGLPTQRNAPSLLNVRFARVFMWDGGVNTLEKQAIVPIQAHNEMNQPMGDLIKELSLDPYYRKQANVLFQRDFDPFVLTRSLAAFERSLLSMSSAYDEFQLGRAQLTSNEQKGLDLFKNHYRCVECHFGKQFTTDGFGRHPNMQDKKDDGRFLITNQNSDKGCFKIPSLRNVELTYPYMHDGRYAQMETVVGEYIKGVKTFDNDGFTGVKVGVKYNLKEDTYYLVSFLKTLTDTSYLKSYR